MAPITDPKEALKISLAQKENASRLRIYAGKLSESLQELQKENHFAPRVAMAYQRRN